MKAKSIIQISYLPGFQLCILTKTISNRQRRT